MSVSKLNEMLVEINKDSSFVKKSMQTETKVHTMAKTLICDKQIITHVQASAAVPTRGGTNVCRTRN